MDRNLSSHSHLLAPLHPNPSAHSPFAVVQSLSNSWSIALVRASHLVFLARSLQYIPHSGSNPTTFLGCRNASVPVTTDPPLPPRSHLILYPPRLLKALPSGCFVAGPTKQRTRHPSMFQSLWLVGPALLCGRPGVLHRCGRSSTVRRHKYRSGSDGSSTSERSMAILYDDLRPN